MKRYLAPAGLMIISACGSGNLHGPDAGGKGGDGSTASAGTGGGSGGDAVGGTVGAAGAAGSGQAGTGGAVRACGASDTFAPIRIQAEVPPGTTVLSGPAAEEMTQIFDVTGMVASVMRIDQPCPADCPATHQPAPQCPICTGGTMPSVRVEVVDRDDKHWAIVVSPEGALAEWEAAAQTVRGKSVSLRITYREGFQVYLALGFTLTDDAGLVMASDGGQFVNALAAADTPSLAVQSGAPICRDAGSCVRVFRELSFQGTTTANVGIADGEVTIGSRRYGARNQGARTLQPGTCGSDSEEASPWSVWLRPSPPNP